jgi:acetyl-CoA carboxylase biotin carboxyl carrier protein
VEIEEIKKLIQLAKEEKLSNISYENDKFKISINLGQEAQLFPSQNIQATLRNENSYTQKENLISDNSKFTNEDKSKFHIITSPFVGTFYSSPGPGKSPFVKLGQTVKKGTPLCVLEAMKIMNEIESDISGEIVEIFVENESVVEFSQPLFKIKLH